jgi:hypothetical protein
VAPRDWSALPANGRKAHAVTDYGLSTDAVDELSRRVPVLPKQAAKADALCG